MHIYSMYMKFRVLWCSRRLAVDEDSCFWAFGKYQASCRIGQWGINVGKLLSARTSAVKQSSWLTSDQRPTATSPTLNTYRWLSYPIRNFIQNHSRTKQKISLKITVIEFFLSNQIYLNLNHSVNTVIGIW